MPFQQFIQESKLVIGNKQFATRSFQAGKAQPILRYTFNIVKTLQKDPNTAEIQIFNLSKDSRTAFQTKGLRVTLDAGYKDNVSTIFEGSLQFGSSVKDGTDWVTNLLAGDGSDEFQNRRINISIKGRVTVANALKTAADAMGLGLGNVNEKANSGSLRSTLTEFSGGKVFSGKAEEVLSKIVDGMGYAWSIQDNQIILLGPNETLGTAPYVLQSINGKSTGLIGSPEAGDDGFIKLRCLLQPSLLPGRRIRVKSREIDGEFRIDKVTFSGDTWGNQWICEIEAKPL